MDCPKLDGKAKDFLKQQKEGHTIVYSGAEERGQKGVAIWLLRKIGESLIGYNPLSNRVLTGRINTKSRCILIILMCSPATTAEEENSDQFSEKLSTAIDRTQKKDVLYCLVLI